jgi:hypothetical protein
MVLIAPFLSLRIVAPMDKMAFWLFIAVTMTVSLQLEYSQSHTTMGGGDPLRLRGNDWELMRRSLWLDTVG